MNEEHDTTRTDSAMEASGLGLLPGLALALVIGVGVIGAALVDSWWVVPVIAVALVVLTATVVAVVLAMLDDEDDSPLRDYVPGL